VKVRILIQTEMIILIIIILYISQVHAVISLIGLDVDLILFPLFIMVMVVADSYILDSRISTTILEFGSLKLKILNH